MTYIEFIEKIRIKAHEELNYPLEMMEFFPDGYTSNDPKIFEWIIDSNTRFFGGTPSPWLKTDFLVLKRKEESSVTTMQRIAIRKLYQDVQEANDKADDKTIIDAAFAKLKQVHEDTIGKHPDALNLRINGEYAKIKEHLILRPLNYNLREYELVDCVYRKINDFVLVLYQLIGLDEKEKSRDKMTHITSSKIKRSELKKWGISEEDVLNEALKNTARLFPPCVFNKKSGQEVNFLTEEGLSKKYITAPFFPIECILLSTFTTTNGSVALFYPGVIDKMLKIMGGSFIVVFMNINDVMICDMGSPFVKSFTEMAQHASQLGEMLSKSAYVCNEKGITPLK